jgi:hypothetical protein
MGRGWRPDTPPVNPTSHECRECRGRLDPERPYPAEGLCARCVSEIQAIAARPDPDAEQIWLEVAALIPVESAPLFAHVRPVAIREGKLVLTARRSYRRWILRRYTEWLDAAAKRPVEILPPREAAALLAAPEIERTTA